MLRLSVSCNFFCVNLLRQVDNSSGFEELLVIHGSHENASYFFWVCTQIISRSVANGVLKFHQWHLNDWLAVSFANSQLIWDQYYLQLLVLLAIVDHFVWVMLLSSRIYRGLSIFLSGENYYRTYCLFSSVHHIHFGANYPLRLCMCFQKLDHCLHYFLITIFLGALVGAMP